MSAFEFILLMILLVAAGTAVYYFILCYPIFSSNGTPKPRVFDPERNQLLPFTENFNNNEIISPNVPNGAVAPVSSPDNAENNDISYPNAADTIRSLNEDDSFQGCEAAGVAATIGVRKNIDEPDCIRIVGAKSNENSPKQERMQECKTEPNGVLGEKRPLLQGDDEDGLILSQPSVRSMNESDSISNLPRVCPPINPTAASQIPSETTPVEAIFTPIPNEISEPDSNYIEESPSDVIIDVQPLSVPPQKNMSTNHSPTPMIVTVPQPLSAPPLIAPVYDEPPMDEQPCISLHHQLHPTESYPPPTSSNNTVPSVIILETHKDDNSDPSETYGWNDNVSNVDQNTDNSNNEELNTDAKPTNVEELVDDATDNDAMAASNNVETEPNVIEIETHSDERMSEDSSNSPDNFSETNKRSKHNSARSESSEPEITEYTFETGPLVPSTRGILANEISNVSDIIPESNVQIVKYNVLDESVALNADASISDSMRVMIGDPIDTDISVTEESPKSEPGESCGIPDLTTCRRSPDGDSMKSDDAEHSKSPVECSETSPQKDGTKHVTEPQTYHRKETEIH